MKTIKLNSTEAVSSLPVALAVAMSLVLGLSTVRGELLFSESFQYPAGSLSGNGPPEGSPPGQTAWATSLGDSQVLAKGLGFLHLFSAGGSVGFADSFSNGDSSYAGISPVNSGIVWIGFLIRQVAGRDTGYATLNLLTPDGSPPPGFGLLFEYEAYGIDNDTGFAHGQAVTTVAPSSTPAWLVVRLNFNTGEEDLFVNPSNSNVEPVAADGQTRLFMTPKFQAAGFDRILLHVGYTGGAFQFDEVRVGTTFADVRTGE